MHGTTIKKELVSIYAKFIIRDTPLTNPAESNRCFLYTRVKT